MHDWRSSRNMSIDLLEAIRKKAMPFFSNSRGSHDWSHTERVYKLSLRIAARLDADSLVVGAAALLHDIGRQQQDESKGVICHAEAGALLARAILEEVALAEERISRVIHCIETHRFRGNKIPQTLEAKILFDADKLDSIGAIGIGRAFQFAGEVGARLHNGGMDLNQTKSYSKEDTAYREFSVKLRKIKDRMLTDEGRKIAEKRHGFMVDFFQRLDDEAAGRI